MITFLQSIREVLNTAQAVTCHCENCCRCRELTKKIDEKINTLENQSRQSKCNREVESEEPGRSATGGRTI